MLLWSRRVCGPFARALVAFVLLGALLASLALCAELLFLLFTEGWHPYLSSLALVAAGVTVAFALFCFWLFWLAAGERLGDVRKWLRR